MGGKVGPLTDTVAVICLLDKLLIERGGGVGKRYDMSAEIMCFSGP
jgi:hypothetical protein